ncbi:MAG: hypothetical protein IPG50_25970 [Myxococcales bacterium]|nr:hypothetical protein [Myxococcales bacterium]
MKIPSWLPLAAISLSLAACGRCGEASSEGTAPGTDLQKSRTTQRVRLARPGLIDLGDASAAPAPADAAPGLGDR